MSATDLVCTVVECKNCVKKDGDASQLLLVTGIW